jgi:hypothetical protein
MKEFSAWLAIVTVLAVLPFLFCGGAAVARSPKAALDTCSGEFWHGDGFYMIDYCSLSEANAKKIMRTCSLGQQCVIKGIVEHCKGVRRACAEMTRVIDVQWGKDLPMCSPSAAADRADEWWLSSGPSSNVSGLKGMIARSVQGDGSTPPYGHTKLLWSSRTDAAAALPWRSIMSLISGSVAMFQ